MHGGRGEALWAPEEEEERKWRKEARMSCSSGRESRLYSTVKV